MLPPPGTVGDILGCHGPQQSQPLPTYLSLAHAGSWPRPRGLDIAVPCKPQPVIRLRARSHESSDNREVLTEGWGPQPRASGPDSTWGLTPGATFSSEFASDMPADMCGRRVC